MGGRPLWAAAADDEAVHLRFDELCQRPTSVGDLIEIAGRWSTVVLAAVPALAAVNVDARRRFADLVDIAWDRDVRLVVLSAHRVDRVLDAEITDRARTTSRLCLLRAV